MSTIGALTILHELVTESLGKKLKVYAAFIDLRKAFDYTDRDILERKMITAGFNRKFAGLIKNLYNSLSLTVRSNGCNYGSIGTKIGCPQGDTCSPGLFNLYTADIPQIFTGNGVLLAREKIVAFHMQTTWFCFPTLQTNCKR